VRFFDPEAITQVRRGKLPHWTQPDVTYFVTFRLADSLPATKLLALREERDLWLRNHPVPLSDADRQEYHRRFNGKFEYWLDQGYGECRLARPDLKSIVETALMYFHGERYRLGESIVMPNHVHVLVTPVESWTLAAILRSWKSYTARQINEVSDRSGNIWDRESFDHIVRSPGQLAKFEHYIRNNAQRWKTA
jgi:REP element-mobilizing transposase RayT